VIGTDGGPSLGGIRAVGCFGDPDLLDCEAVRNTAGPVSA
jgi:hypothetical protein